MLIIASLFSAGLAIAVLLRKRQSWARWCFVAGMLVFAVESAFGAMTMRVDQPEKAELYQRLALLIKSLVPGVWLCFSLTYSRGNFREFLLRWRPVLVTAFLLPFGAIFVVTRDSLAVLKPEGPDAELWIRFGMGATVLNSLLLVSTILIVMNLERTFRSAVGTMQWRIKFMILGLAVVFGARIYTRSQTILFSGYDFGLLTLEGGALIVGCLLISVAYLRTGFSEVDVYPSRAVLHTSFTVLLAGSYLFVVGVLAQIVARRGQPGSFRLHALLVLVAVAVLAVILLSDRLRQQIRLFISRHFKRPGHDFRKIWTLFTRSTANVVQEEGICSTCARLISTTFDALSVSVWLFDEHKEHLLLTATTSQQGEGPIRADSLVQVSDVDKVAPDFCRPFDLEKAGEDWIQTLRQMTANQFRKGGSRVCVPLRVRDRWLGVVVLGDRVSGIPYTGEDFDLLQCVGDQIASALLNVRLTEEILRGRELEAFQTMSAFFVHDLKNVTSTLTLMLQNLPVHFDKREFREDALRGISKTIARINELISRFGALRRDLRVAGAPVNLNKVLEEAIQSALLPPAVDLRLTGEALPEVVGDREQLQSVVTNLLINAVDAIAGHGQIDVSTTQSPGWASISVSDNGCGMSADFMRDSLFRPFRSTKKNGLGIGMFQSKIIIEAHGGRLQVKSELGVGTTFGIMLPLPSRNS